MVVMRNALKMGMMWVGLGVLVSGLVGCGVSYPPSAAEPTKREYFFYLDRHSADFSSHNKQVNDEVRSVADVLAELTQLIAAGLTELNSYLPEPRFFMHTQQGAVVPEDANAIITLEDLENFVVDVTELMHGEELLDTSHDQPAIRVVGTGQMKFQTSHIVDRSLLHRGLPLEMAYRTTYGMNIQLSNQWIWEQLTAPGDRAEAERMVQLLLFHEIGHGIGIDHAHDVRAIMHPIITLDKDVAAFGDKVVAELFDE